MTQADQMNLMSKLKGLTYLPRAILFDNDGVLIASERLHWAAWNKLLAEMGIPYKESDIQKQVGKTGPEIMAALLDEYRPGWNPEEFNLDALAYQKNNYYVQAVPTDLQAYPGVREGLVWLKNQGVKTAVVSNAKKRELVTALNSLKLDSYFDVLLSRDDVPAPKPDPSAYLFGAASVGEAPEDCLVIEDSPTGIEAALFGKIPAAAVLTNFSRAVMESPVPGRPDLQPHWIGESTAEFFEWLKTLQLR